MRGFESFLEALPAILTSPTFLIVAAAWFSAQLTKVALHYLRTHKLNWKLLTETGGMPSSHSAFVTSMTTCMGLSQGWTSGPFLVALGISIIIMHDAAGLRMAAGRQATLLNQIVAGLYEGRKAKPPKMKELLGHSPLQVLSGALLGMLVAFCLYPAK